MKHRAFSAAIVAAFLTGCGGGSSQETINGKLVDGYISGATVFWDCNSNNVVDSGEPSTITLSGGVYQLPQKPSDSGSFLYPHKQEARRLTIKADKVQFDK